MKVFFAKGEFGVCFLSAYFIFWACVWLDFGFWVSVRCV